MNRKHLPLVVSLLVLLLPACLCPISSATSPSAEATLVAHIAQTATALAHFAESATAIAAGGQQTNTPELTDTPAATPTKTEPPATSTPSPTNTPQPPTESPTEQPPLPPIADPCKLLDTKLAGDLLGEKMVDTFDISVKGSWDACTTANPNAGVILDLAQDRTAVKLLVTMYAEIDAVKDCAMPVPVGAAAVKKEQNAFDKLGLIGNKLVREAFSWVFKLIKDKGCTGQYGVQAIPGLGDLAYADHIYGFELIRAVYRNTLISINAVKQGITAAQAVDVDQKLLADAIQRLEPK